MRPPNIVPYIKHALFAPGNITITALIVAIYAAIFISSIVVYESVPAPPKPQHQRGLNLEQAWRDLQLITQVPHPYNSHSNGQVRDYLLHRLRGISHTYPHVELDNDRISNGTYSGGGRVVYFEGDNLLVKISGKTGSVRAGATDDGMGVVTLLQLVEYYARNRPKRTTVFNINNGEEDWLNGAHAFLDHPWSKLPKTFLNLEGAGNGGRPILFRSSSFDVTTAFRSVSRPHGSSLSSDAFKRGLIRSGTDFSVYEEAGMRGLDLAFYRRRARYHTVFDSAAWLGNQNSLWIMMESALEAGNALVSAGTSGKPVDAVYFDRLINRFKEDKKVWIHAPVRLVATLVATLGLAAIFAIAYSSSYVVAASLVSVAILAIIIPAKILAYYFPSPDPLLTTANHAIFTVFWWFALCIATGALNEKHLGGFYYATFAYAGQLFSLLLSLGAMLHFDDYPTLGQPNGAGGDHLMANIKMVTTKEQMAKNPMNEPACFSVHTRPSISICDSGIGPSKQIPLDLVAEILFSLLFPSILASGTMIMLLTALSQTLADGNSPMTVYLAIGFLSVLLALPIAPVAHRIHTGASFFLALVVFTTAIYSLTAFPFSPLNPLKVYAQQTIDLDSGINKVHLVTLPSLNLYNKDQPPLWYSLPSTQRQPVFCSSRSKEKDGLGSCEWPGLVPNVTLDSTRPSHWIKSSVTKIGRNVARFEVQGRNTRRWALGKWFTDRRRVQRNSAVEPNRTGKIACEWAEWDLGKIPAIDELRTFLPPWTVVSKLADGLVEGTREFKI
ncbi:Peptidase family M28 [Rhizoctonia solani]|uniref:Peptide hydrolase n=1 Tax=Rhizoctonia solani TaxID=456999 RepID=A0A8H7M5Z9_9AGAM|nr:Peptidase family M28 [Rhizoctonia solani]